MPVAAGGVLKVECFYKLKTFVSEKKNHNDLVTSVMC